MPLTTPHKMKNKASNLLKKITSVFSAIAKAKSMAVNSKFSATKARLLMLSMVKTKKLVMDSLSHKIHTILGQHDPNNDDENDNDDHNKAIVLYDHNQYRASRSMPMVAEAEEEEDDDKYPDLTHSLFDKEDDYDIDDAKLQAAGGSIIDMMRNSKEGEEFKLEEEIDEAADLFIKRFRKQIRLQKLESFKRLQEMLARGT